VETKFRPFLLTALRISCLLVGLCFFCWSAEEEDAEQPVIEFTNLSLARARLKKKIMAELSLRNTGPNPLTSITLVMTLLEDGKELRKTATGVIKKLGPGKSASVGLSAEQCPYFTSYRIFLEYGDNGRRRKFVFKGQPGSPPTLERTSPARGMCLLAITDKKSEWKETKIKAKKQSVFVLTIWVKNEGDVPCEKTDVVVRFYDENDRQLDSIPRPLDGGDIAGWTEKQFKLELEPKCGDKYDYFTIEVTPKVAATDAVIEEGEFTDAAAIEVAKWRLKRDAGRGLTISARVRNGLDRAVKNVVVRVVLENEKASPLREVCHMLEESIAPGGIVPFESHISEPPLYAGFSFDLSYEEDVPQPGTGGENPTSE
jgi:hypothetical protein